MWITLIKQDIITYFIEYSLRKTTKWQYCRKIFQHWQFSFFHLHSNFQPLAHLHDLEHSNHYQKHIFASWT